MAVTDIPVIAAGRVILRPHRLADFDAYAEMWAEPSVTRFIGGRARSREESWLRFLRHAGMWSMLGYGYWAIEDAESGAFAGEGGFHDLKRGMTPSIEGLPEAGWALRGTWQGRGIASEVVGAMVGWADHALDAPKTVCIIDPLNVASIRVAERNGYAKVGEAIYGDDRPGLYERPRGVRASVP
ncbi:MAG: GNAT family N-acetyltransferase [Rhizobiaceae bacterium]|nr:GNAT family N-acetyltransferase [Rhizobiaceae bacterium]